MLGLTFALFGITAVSFLLDGFVATKLLTLTALAILFIGIAASARDRRLGFVDPFVIFVLSFLQYYILPPLDAVFFPDFSLPAVIFSHIAPDQDGPLVRGLVTSIIGLVAVIAGYQGYLWAAGGMPASRRAGEWIFDERRLKIAVPLCAMAGIGSYLLLFYYVGFAAFFGTQRDLRADLVQETGGLDTFAYFWETAIVLLSVYLIERNKRDLRWTMILIVLMFIPPTILLIGFVSGSRILILRPALIIAFYAMLATGNARLGARAVAVLGIAAFIVIVGGMVRRYVGGNMSTLIVEAPRFLDASYLYGIVVQSLDFTTTHDIYLLLHERPFDLGYGDTYLKMIYQFVPRPFWPDKPENISVIAAELFRPDQWNRGVSYNPTVFGEMYYNFANWGVAGLCFIVGIFLSWLTRFGCRAGDNPPLRLLYAVLVVSIIEQGRGAFSNISDTYILFYVLPILAVSKRRSVVPGSISPERLRPAGGECR